VLSSNPPPYPPSLFVGKLIETLRAFSISLASFRGHCRSYSTVPQRTHGGRNNGLAIMLAPMVPIERSQYVSSLSVMGRIFGASAWSRVTIGPSLELQGPREGPQGAGLRLRLRSGAAETREITLPRSISTPRHHFATRRPVMKSDLPSTFNPWIRALTTASVPRPPIRLTTQPVTFRRTRGVRSFHWPRPCVQKPCPSSSLKCILSAGVSLSLDTVLKEYASGYF
jgi:hypothetical protein